MMHFTREMFERIADQFTTADRGPTFLITHRSTFDAAGRMGQAEALDILSGYAAATRSIFGDILTGIIGPPNLDKAARWIIGNGSWPYTAPDPEPPAFEHTWAAIERTTSFWRSTWP